MCFSPLRSRCQISAENGQFEVFICNIIWCYYCSNTENVIQCVFITFIWITIQPRERTEYIYCIYNKYHISISISISIWGNKTFLPIQSVSISSYHFLYHQHSVTQQVQSSQIPFTSSSSLKGNKIIRRYYDPELKLMAFSMWNSNIFKVFTLQTPSFQSI